MSNVYKLSERNFKVEVLKSSLPTLVDFWAPWCAPCRAVGPIVEQLAAERGNSIKVAKLNVDEAPDVAATILATPCSGPFLASALAQILTPEDPDGQE